MRVLLMVVGPLAVVGWIGVRLSSNYSIDPNRIIVSFSVFGVLMTFALVQEHFLRFAPKGSRGARLVKRITSAMTTQNRA